MMGVTLEINPVHLPRSLKTQNWACGAFRTNTEKCSVSLRCGSSASYRDKCSGWVLIGASITCAVMQAEQRQPSNPAAPESPAVPRHSCVVCLQTSPWPASLLPASLAAAMLCSPPCAPEVFLLDNAQWTLFQLFSCSGLCSWRGWLLVLTPSLLYSFVACIVTLLLLAAPWYSYHC